MNIWITGEGWTQYSYMADVMDQKSVKLGTSSALVRGEAWQWQGLRFSAHWPLQVATIKEITIPVWLRLMTGRKHSSNR